MEKRGPVYDPRGWVVHIRIVTVKGKIPVKERVQGTGEDSRVAVLAIPLRAVKAFDR